jgi:DNA-binding IclR family transcriptional regulator
MDPVAYKAELVKVRGQGYTIDDQEEYLLGVKAISVPLRDIQEVVAALTIAASPRAAATNPARPRSQP